MKRYEPKVFQTAQYDAWAEMAESPDGEWVRFEDYDNCRQLLSLVMDQPTDMQVALDNAKRNAWIRAEELDEIRTQLKDAREWSSELADIGDRYRGEYIEAIQALDALHIACETSHDNIYWYLTDPLASAARSKVLDVLDAAEKGGAL